MITFKKGSIFKCGARVLVNPVNTVGVMGAGLAKIFKEKYPEMFADYRRTCIAGVLEPGTLHLWRGKDVVVVNLPTKTTWMEPSQYEYVDLGLQSLAEFLKGEGRVKVAIPALGCGLGGLEWNKVKDLIKANLGKSKADILVFEPH